MVTRAVNLIELSKEGSFREEISEARCQMVSYQFCQVNHFLIDIDDGPFSTFEDGFFNDESFSIKHKEAGLLGMSKEMGHNGTNECMFYITTSAPLSYMDNKNVVFGRIVNGMRSVKMIEKIECFNQKPNGKIEIINAGIYDGK